MSTAAIVLTVDLSPQMQEIRSLFINLENTLMATIDDLKATITAERAQVTAAIDELKLKLEEAINAGGATPAQLEELKNEIDGIFTPAPPA